MRRGWLRRNRLTTTPPAHDSSVRVGAPGRTRLPTPPPAHDSCVREGGGFHFYSSLLLLQALHTPLSQRAKSKSSPISLVKSLSRGLGHKTRRPPGRLCRRSESRFFWLFCCWDTARAYTGEYPIPLARPVNTGRPIRQERNLKKRPGNRLTPSGGSSATRYTPAAPPLASQHS